MSVLTGMHNADVRSLLRAQTDDAHSQLHLHSSFAALFEGALGRRDYARLIHRLHGFYAPLDDAIEGTLAGKPAGFSGYSYARRSDLLAQDIADIGVSIPQKADATCDQAHAIVTPSTLGGILYVIEGATLGGARIDRAATRILQSDSVAGRRYWDWCRAQGKFRWPATLRLLDHLHKKGASTDDLATGARNTFRLLADWLAPLEKPQSTVESVNA